MSSKESGKVRYAYGVAMALLLGGTAFSLATGQAGAQVAQNAPSAMAPRAGAPMSFADLAARLAAGGGQHLDQAARAGPQPRADPFEEFFRRFGGPVGPQGGSGSGQRQGGSGSSRAPAKPARSARASSFRPTATSSPTTT